MQALVLAGGSIEGAFQAGALGEVLSRGFAPRIITGFSVGALNGGFLTERAGRAAGPLRGYRSIPIRIIQPAMPIAVQIDSFTSENITDMLALGRFAAREVMNREAG